MLSRRMWGVADGHGTPVQPAGFIVQVSNGFLDSACAG